MSYKDGYKIRKEYGNDAESVFLRYCRDQNIPYGKFGVEPYLEDRKIEYSHPLYYQMDNRLKKQPDYIIWDDQMAFVEIKASGIDDNNNYVLRIKEEDVNGYSYWNIFNPVYIFIAYNYNKKYILVNLNKIIQEMKKVEQMTYPHNYLNYRTIQIDKLKEYDRITLL